MQRKSFFSSNSFKRVGQVTLFLIVFFGGIHTTYALVSNLVDFNTTNDLTDNFNSDGSVQFTNVVSGGIENTGAIDVPLGTTDIWTTKQGYSVAGEGDVYTFSAYFKIKANSGYGGLGFSTIDTNTGDSQGQPLTGIGVSFHGGGGSFVNNRVYTTLSWPPDLVIGNWYKMIFEVSAQGGNTYDLNFQIWNSDADGVLNTLKTEKTLSGVVNTDLGGASIIHGFFAAAGSRMEKIDDFLIELEGGAGFIDEGLPVVLTTAVSDVAMTTAIAGGNVSSDQGSSVTVRGVCYSTSTEPTTADTCTTDNTGEGVFSSSVVGLLPGTQYYVRAYATNAEGTSYGSELTFTTLTDTTAPTLTSLVPLNGAVDVAIDSLLDLNFSESVQWASEPDSVRVYRASDDVLFFAQAGGTGGGTASLRLAFPMDFEPATEYYVLVDDNAITDLADNSFAGITTSSQWRFTTIAAPDPEPQEDESRQTSSGSSVTGRVQNLMTMGKIKDAQELVKQYPSVFESQTTTTASPVHTSSDKKCPITPSDRVLRAGSKGEDVRALQQFLNCTGFLLGVAGPGSPGNETTLFSIRTYDALIRFQEQYASDILAPLNRSTGTGIFAELSKKKAIAL